MKGVKRFCRKGKLGLRFIRPFEVLEKIRKLAYGVGLPPMLAGVHNEERPTQILDRQERKLQNKVIHMVKVKWLNHSEEKATWKTETDMRSRYPELFVESEFRGRNFI
ncbi:uncharacterized protein [Primulina huaijiensis]|uniref:uncharacterized protein n=1 Tax=Primulina huaijiensis TaxID=1492673 RepID=UPI003CC772FE